MIRTRGFTIGGLMWVTFVIGFGLAALRNASETWAGIVFLVTCGVLACATVAAVCRPAAERPWWLGFVLFGGGYLLLAYRDPSRTDVPALPTSRVLHALTTWFGQDRSQGPGFGGKGGTGFRGWVPPSPDHFLQIGHCLWSLVLATMGGMLTLALCGLSRSRSRTDAPAPAEASREETSSKWWRRPAAIALGGAGLFLALTLAAYPRDPELLAGIVYLTTCALVGAALLGAILGRGRRRAAWLGAALFGGSYLGFQLNPAPDGDAWPPCGAVNHVLSAVRPWLISGVKVLHGTSFVIDNDNLRIRQKLEQRVAMPFPNETPLEDVLKHIKGATQGPNDSGIPIYVDPIGLQEAEKTMQSPVQLDLEGLPVRVTLSLMLKQLGMTYYVRDGLLIINSDEPYDVPPTIVDDPYLLIGHCILTCLAAALGSVLAPLVADTRQGAAAPTSS